MTIQDRADLRTAPPAQDTVLGRLRRAIRLSATDVTAFGCYLVGALVVFAPLWHDLRHRYLVNGMQDQQQWEWFFVVTARAAIHLDNPLFTTLQNQPYGVNLMANTAMPGLSIPLAPATLLLGPTVTWAFVLTGGMAATAGAWYWLLSRHLVRSRLAAAIGGGFCGFAPPLVSHANAHPNFVVLFMFPFIVRQMLRLYRRKRPVHDGAVLGLLVAYQFFLGEEALLLAATGLAVYGVAYALMRPAETRTAAARFIVGTGVGAGVCLALVAYPLWWQFNGPQSYTSLLHGPNGNDVHALVAFASQSVAGDPAVARTLSINPTEENGFFGWPLALLVAVIAVWMWRSVQARALTVVIMAMAALSLGATVVVGGRNTGIPGLWRLLDDLPLYESVIPSRFALACVPAIGALLALGADRVFAFAPTQVPTSVRRSLWTVALVAALLPIAPTSLAAIDREATPRFFSEGTWRGYVGPGRTVVTVPLPNGGYDARALQWQVDADLGFALAGGYFVGPYGPERRGIYGAVPTVTSQLLDAVSQSGVAPVVTDGMRQAALADLRLWRADLVVLAPRAQQDALRTTVEGLLGPARRVDDVWIWDVRQITR